MMPGDRHGWGLFLPFSRDLGSKTVLLCQLLCFFHETLSILCPKLYECLEVCPSVLATGF